jgi:hypothetical protein
MYRENLRRAPSEDPAQVLLDLTSDTRVVEVLDVWGPPLPTHHFVDLEDVVSLTRRGSAVCVGVGALVAIDGDIALLTLSGCARFRTLPKLRAALHSHKQGALHFIILGQQRPARDVGI